MIEETQNITIREAETIDFENIISLLKEFAQFQKTPDKITITAEQMKQDKNLFHCLLAETTDNIIVGFITYFPAYYSWSGKALYVDDLYVTKAFRKNGIGKRLLNAVISLARENEYKKVRWQVSQWNTNAIEFYKSIGAVVDGTESNCDYML